MQFPKNFSLQVFLCTITGSANQECKLALIHKTQDSSIPCNIAKLEFGLAKKVVTSRWYAASTI